MSAEHLPGKQNYIADQESRTQGDSSEWKLKPSVFKQLMEQLGPCQIDRFASRLTAQLKTYMSWRPDPGAVATDALSQSWNQIKGYAFPPFSLIGRCLTKVRREQVPEIVLITPIYMANSDLVSSVGFDDCQKTNPDTSNAGPINKPQGRESPTHQPRVSESSCVASIRSLSAEGISEAASKLILASWRSSTEGTYSSCWSRWERWCAERGLEAIRSPLNAILEFLAFEYLQGKQYRTINSYQSAISMTHGAIDGVVIGKHH